MLLLMELLLIYGVGLWLATLNAFYRDASSALGLLLQWWTNATDARQFGFLPVHFQGFAFRVSGKPIFSLPANIPVIFELTVLLAALGAFFGMLVANNLPLFHRPLLAHPRFRSAITAGTGS